MQNAKKETEMKSIKLTPEQKEAQSKMKKITLTSEQKKALSENVKKQNEQKAKKLSSSSFWDLKKALIDKGSETDKLDLKLDKISAKVQRKLRNSFLRPEQKKLAHNFLTAFNQSQISNTFETRTKYENSFIDFHTFNKTYLKDAKLQFSQKSDDSEERKNLDLAYSYYFQVSN